PDFIDIYTGVFTYFGDNKRPGRALHDTQRHGNELLRSCFATLHDAPDQRVKIPPFLVFTKGDKGRNVIFRGLARLSQIRGYFLRRRAVNISWNTRAWIDETIDKLGTLCSTVTDTRQGMIAVFWMRERRTGAPSGS